MIDTELTAMESCAVKIVICGLITKPVTSVGHSAEPGRVSLGTREEHAASSRKARVFFSFLSLFSREQRTRVQTSKVSVSSCNRPLRQQVGGEERRRRRRRRVQLSRVGSRGNVTSLYYFSTTARRSCDAHAACPYGCTRHADAVVLIILIGNQPPDEWK